MFLFIFASFRLVYAIKKYESKWDSTWLQHGNYFQSWNGTRNLCRAQHEQNWEVNRTRTLIEISWLPVWRMYWITTVSISILTTNNVHNVHKNYTKWKNGKTKDTTAAWKNWMSTHPGCWRSEHQLKHEILIIWRWISVVVSSQFPLPFCSAALRVLDSTTWELRSFTQSTNRLEACMGIKDSWRKFRNRHVPRSFEFSFCCTIFQLQAIFHMTCELANWSIPHLLEFNIFILPSLNFFTHIWFDFCSSKSRKWNVPSSPNFYFQYIFFDNND